MALARVAAALAVVITASPAAAQCLGDDDGTMAQITEAQFGQGLACWQVIPSNFLMCGNPDIAQICCATCERHAEEESTAREIRWAELAPRQSALRLALSAAEHRLRSPPLHGQGRGMPLVAVGTGGLLGAPGADLLTFALQAGFRHIDSAIMYQNHGAVRKAFERSGVPRDEVFITSKVPPDMMGHERAAMAVDRIGSELPGGYADLCLVHWPYSTHWQESRPKADGDEAAAAEPPAEWSVVERAGTWRALETAFRAGTCRAIGVSNYMVKHLEEVWRYAHVRPSVNQLEFSPLAPIQDVREHCLAHGVVLQGFGWRRSDVLESVGVQNVAAELGRTPTQVVMRWFLQQGMTPLFKTKQEERLLAAGEDVTANFELSEAHLAAITQPREDYKFNYYKGGSAPWQMPVIRE